MTMYLAGLGTALPPYRVTQADAAEIAKSFYVESPTLDRLLPALYRRTGVAGRHSVLLEQAEGQVADRQNFYPPAQQAADGGPSTATRMARYATDAPPLALAAAGAAWQHAGLPPTAATHLITVSCTGFMAPGVDLSLIASGGLPHDVARTHIGFMGCHGAINGLRVAQAIVAAEPAACVLLCAVELCSLHYHYGDDPEQVVANALFADGAAALVCTGRKTAAHPRSDGWQLQATGGCVFPQTADAMTWTLGNHGFAMTLSPRTPALIEGELAPWMASWLAQHGLGIADIENWVVHPGGPRILQATQAALGLPDDALRFSRQVLAECGNMSSPTVLFILDRLSAAGGAGPSVMLGFGPGLAIEAALLNR